MFTFRIVTVIIIFSFIFIGCSKQKDDKTSSENNTSLVKKDSVSGKEKAQLKYMPKKGEKFGYRVTAKTSTTEKSPATENKEMASDNEINYFYTKEVSDVDGSGIISYKVKYDSIKIRAKVEGQDVSYSSNINDSMKSNPAFIQYNVVIGEDFFIRVSPEGEITDVYGMEKIHEKLFKALGDTLKEEEKAQIKESFGKESIKEILQQEYQIFPKNEIMVDSSWIKSFSTQVLVFDVTNNAKYTLKSIETKDKQTLVNVEATLTVDFLNKEVKDKGMKFKVENSETNGSGKIQINLTRGCIVSKETTTMLKIGITLSAQGQTARSDQSVNTNLSVALLN